MQLTTVPMESLRNEMAVKTRAGNISEVMEVTTIGECNEFFPNATRVSCPRYDKCEEDLVASHRFYLSFENSECKEYITEKFFNRISQLLVPIVQNRVIYSEEETCNTQNLAQDIPQDSFLAISDYDNLNDMAKHIDFLMRNDSAYLEYFKWTKIYRKPNIFTSKVLCDLCADLYAKKRMRIDNIRKYYFMNQCGPIFDN
ncbi:hypothetical protein OESDEN_02479 [Oesophagostomum dentatum]|uniref:Fucosyltransferase n=1 Tax=Oesophagostomum dentatum TaxID=61180 RepID=A0A0B1TJW8_OESDE|nr:hypothetical protein OESDEN_02479 [Oesophagostomum dentatum]